MPRLRDIEGIGEEIVIVLSMCHIFQSNHQKNTGPMNPPEADCHVTLLSLNPVTAPGNDSM
jgi:hypothetical protein